MSKNYLDARAVLSADDFVYADVDCPEWGGTVHVRGLTAGERSSISRRVKAGDQQDLEISVVIFGAVDQNGDRLFTKADRDQLKQKSNTVVNRLARRILELSGGDDETMSETKKNSE
ncbi:MAG: hypothetical protein IJU38_07060 [Clostridia bacterium]|nr:hypothetical protein [Clostridia bacterium]